MTVSETIKVRYEETDRMGAVYYANYLVWFEVGRTSFLKSAGIPYSKMEETFDCVLPVIEAHCVYRKAVGFEDEVRVETSIAHLTRRSIKFNYYITHKNDLVAEGYTRHICVSKNMKVKSFPPEVYNILLKAKG